MKSLLKTKVKVYCTICGSSMTRNVSIETENHPEAIKEAKVRLTAKALKPYTCRVCASIVNA